MPDPLDGLTADPLDALAPDKTDPLDGLEADPLDGLAPDAPSSGSEPTLYGVPKQDGRVGLVSAFDNTGRRRSMLESGEALLAGSDPGLGTYHTPEGAAHNANLILDRGKRLKTMDTHSDTPEARRKRALEADAAAIAKHNERTGTSVTKTVVGSAAGLGPAALAKIPGALTRVAPAVWESAAERLGLREQFKKVQPFLPPSMGGVVAPDAFNAVDKGIEKYEKDIEYALPAGSSPIIVDPVSGEEFLNPAALKDPRTLGKILGAEAVPLVIQAALATSTGGASALNPALVAKLSKLGKAGQLTLKALGWAKSAPVKAMVGFEAARTLPGEVEEMKKGYRRQGMSGDDSERLATLMALPSSALQGAVGGTEVGIINKMLKGNSVKLLARFGKYALSGFKEGTEEAAQKAISLAVQKMTSRPELTLGQALREVIVDGAAGSIIGGGMHGVVRSARVEDRRKNTVRTPTQIQSPETEAPKPAFREATEEEKANLIVPGERKLTATTAEEEALLLEAMKRNPDGVSITRPDESPAEAYARETIAGLEMPKPEPPKVMEPAKASDKLAEEQLAPQDEITTLRENRVKLQNELETAKADMEKLRQAGRRGKSEEWAEANARVNRLTNEVVKVDEQLVLNTGKTYEELQGEPAGVTPKEMNETASKWQNTRTAWGEIKKENMGRANMGIDPTQVVRLITAAAKDGYKNVSEWLHDMRTKMGEDFRAFYNGIGGLEGASRLWDEHNLGLKPGESKKPVNPMSREFQEWSEGKEIKGEDGKPARFFHGTLDEFDGFKPDRRGIFFATDPDFSNNYARGNSGRVIPAYLKSEKSFDYNNKDSVSEFAEWYKDNPSKWLQNTEDPATEVARGDWGVMESSAFQKFLKENGYDAYYMVENGKRNIAVLDPKQIKSSLTNTGQYSKDSGMIADNLGLQQMYEAALGKAKEKLGLEKTASEAEVAQEILGRIGRMGSTVRETAVRIMAKIKGISRQLADQLAQWLHDFKGGTKKGQRGAIGKDINAVVRNEIKETLQGDDKKAARGVAYSQIGQVIETPTQASHEKALQTSKSVPPPPMTRKFRKEYLSAAYKLMSPAIISIRDQALQQVNKAVSRFNAAKENVLYSFGETTAQWDALTQDQHENLSAALLYGTTASNGTGKVWSEAELKKHFPAMTDATIKVYGNIIAHMKASTKQLIDAETKVYNEQVAKAKALVASDPSKKKATEEGMAELAKAFRARIEALSNNAYFPLMRFGDYRLAITTKPDENGKTETIGMAFIEDPEDAEEIAARIREMAGQSEKARKLIDAGEYVQEKITKNPDIDASGPSIPDPSLLHYMLAAKNLDHSIVNQIELAAYNAYLGGSWKSRLAHRTGLPGYNMDGLKVYKHYAHQLSTRIANLEQGGEIDSALDGMSDKSRGTAKYDPNLEKEARDIVNSLRNPPYIPAANMLTALAFIADIGFKVSFVAQNLTQQGIIATPVLSSFYGAEKTTAALIAGNAIAKSFLRLNQLGGVETFTAQELESLIKENVTAGKFSAFKDPEGVAEMVKAVLLSSAKDGELRPKVSMDLMAKRDTVGMSPVEASMTKIAEVAGYFASKSEQQNRIATVAAAAALAFDLGVVTMGEGGWTMKKSTGDPKEIREFAEFANRIINFAAGPGNMSWYQRQTGVGGGILKIATQYKRFMVDAMTVLHNTGVINARNKGTWGAKAYAYAKPTLVSYAITTVLGGASAIPAWLVLRSILKGALEDFYEDFIQDFREKLALLFEEQGKKAGLSPEAAKQLGMKTAFSIENGVTNMLPGGFAFNLNAALSPQLVMGKSDASIPEMAGNLFLGSLGGKAATIFDSMNSAWDMNGFGEGFKKAFSGAPRAYYEAITGVTKVGKEEMPLSPQERALRAGSFQPTEVGMVRQKQGENFSAYRQKGRLVKTLKRDYANANEDAKDAMLEKVRDRAERFNEIYGERYPRLKIDIRRDVIGASGREYLPQLYEEAGVKPR